MAVLGIDVAKATLEVHLVTDTATHRAQFTNDAAGIKKLLRWLAKRTTERIQVGMEATNRYWEAVAYALHEAQHSISVINPKLIARHAETTMRRNKTDPQDAMVIADFVAKHQPRAWQPPSAARRELTCLARHRQALLDDRQRARNRLASLPPSAQVRGSLERQIEFLDAELAQLAGQLKQQVKQDAALYEDYQLLLSIPGIGAITALRLLAELPDLGLFGQASQLAAFAGLTPGQRQSGSSIRGPGHLVKWGNSHLRGALYMPALSAGRFNPVVKALKERLAERGKHNLTIIVAMMRKLLHLAYGVLKTRQPFNPDYAA